MNLLTTPGGDMFNLARFGGVKAVDDGFLILDAGSSDLLVYVEAPTNVAMAWRDALTERLANHRRNRPVAQLNWLAIAAEVDPQWAAENAWVGPAAPPAGATTAPAAE
jgi:hypothetical protein